jgi:hypothetical protein
VSVFYTWQDVLTLQRAISDDYKLLDPAVQSCNVLRKLSDTDLGAWDVMQGRVAAYTRLDSAVFSVDTIVDQGKALQADLLKWHAKLRSLGCAVPDAPTPVNPSSSFGDFGSVFAGLLKPEVLLVLAVVYILATSKRR